MKKVIICNISMKKDIDQTVYISDDKSLPVTDRPVRYSINAFLEKTLKADDEIKQAEAVLKGASPADDSFMNAISLDEGGSSPADQDDDTLPF